MEYFRITILEKKEGRYPLIAESSTAYSDGELELESHKSLAKLVAGAPTESVLVDIGSRLFRSLFFSQDVERLYQRTMARIDGVDSGRVRVLLRVIPAELDDVPWELLYDPYNRLFLAADTRVSLIRAPKLTSAREAQPIINRPVRILAIFPQSSGLDFEQEKLSIISLGKSRPDIRVEVLGGPATEDAIRRALRRVKPLAIHFGGHADYLNGKPRIQLDDSSGLASFKTASEFALLVSREESVRLVFLAACESARGVANPDARGLAGEILMKGPAIVGVVGFSTALISSRASNFSAELYGFLADSAGDLPSAVGIARRRLLEDRSHDPTFASPILFSRSDQQEEILDFSSIGTQRLTLRSNRMGPSTSTRVGALKRERAEVGEVDELGMRSFGETEAGRILQGTEPRDWATRLLNASNASAAQLFEEEVLWRKTSGGSTILDRARLAGGYWEESELEDQRAYVDVRRQESPESVQGRIKREISERRSKGRGARIWMVAGSGLGKTTTLYRIYFELALSATVQRAGAEASQYPIPWLVQPQKLDNDAVGRLRDAEEGQILEELFSIWCSRRGLRLDDGMGARVAMSLQESLQTGSVILLLDSYDELRRMRLHREVFETVLNMSKFFLCATRPEFAPNEGEEMVVRMAGAWDLKTIGEFLRCRLRGHASRREALLSHIARRGGEDWLRNPRYLRMFVSLWENDSAGARNRFVSYLERGQYALLQSIYRATLQRVRRIEKRAGRDVSGLNLEARKLMAQLARNQLLTGRLVVSQIEVESNRSLQAILGATEIVKSTIAMDGSRRLSLVNHNWVDFFLVGLVLEELWDEAAELSLHHLWSQDLLRYLAEASARNNDGRRLAEQIQQRLPSYRESLHRTPRSDGESGARTERCFGAINLIHLLVELEVSRIVLRDGLSHFEARHQVEIQGEDFSSLNLEGVNLSRLRMRHCRFNGACLDHARLEYGSFDRCLFEGASLRSTRAEFAKFVFCDFSQRAMVQDVKGSPFLGMSIQGASFESHLSGQQDQLLAGGAELQKSRYVSPFGTRFFLNSGSCWATVSTVLKPSIFG